MTYRVRGAGEPEPGGCAGFVGFILMMAATVALVAASLVVTAVGVVLTPSSWLAALDEAQAYDRAPSAIADQVVAWVESQPVSQPRTLAPLDRSDVEAIVVALAPPDFLRSQAALIVPAVIDGMATTGQPHAVVSLAAFKARFTSGPLLATVLDRVATWPACDRAQLQKLSEGVLSRCQPPGASQSQLALATAGLFSVVAAELPDSVDLVAPGTAPGSGSLTSSSLAEPIRLVGQVRPFLATLLLVTLLLLVGASLLVGRTWRRLVRVWAVPLLVGGLAVLGLALLVDPLLAAAVASLESSLAASGLTASLASIVTSAAGSLVDRAGWLLLGAGGALLAAALILLLLSLWPRRRQEDQAW